MSASWQFCFTKTALFLGRGGSLLFLADGMTLPAWLNTTHENAEIINITTKLIDIRKKKLFPNKNKIKVHCTVYL